MHEIPENPYFRVKCFSIVSFENDQMKEYFVPREMREFICSEKYPLNSVHDIHYDPKGFFNYLKFISNKNPDVTYIIFYKYIYYNHKITEYQNKMIVENEIITNNLLI
jgi:hypothetical protein